MHERELYLAVGCVRGGWKASRSTYAFRAHLANAVLCGRGGRGALRGLFAPLGRLGWSVCMTNWSVRAYGVVGGAGAGRSRVKKQDEPSYGLDCRGRAVREIGGGRESAQMLPRLFEIGSTCPQVFPVWRFLGLQKFHGKN